MDNPCDQNIALKLKREFDNKALIKSFVSSTPQQGAICDALENISFTIFTTTKDLNAEFPALAARLLGWQDIALMCANEIDVPGAQKLCIRVLLTINTEKSQKELINVYLRDAINLKSRGITE